MHGISEIKRQNAQNQADLDADRSARYSLYNGGKTLLLVNGSKSKHWTDKKDIAGFLASIKNKNRNQIAKIIQDLFQPPIAVG